MREEMSAEWIVCIIEIHVYVCVIAQEKLSEKTYKEK